jgi:hypothetical protein
VHGGARNRRYPGGGRLVSALGALTGAEGGAPDDASGVMRASLRAYEECLLLLLWWLLCSDELVECDELLVPPETVFRVERSSFVMKIFLVTPAQPSLRRVAIGWPRRKTGLSISPDQVLRTA